MIAAVYKIGTTTIQPAQIYHVVGIVRLGVLSTLVVGQTRQSAKTAEQRATLVHMMSLGSTHCIRPTSTPGETMRGV